MKWTPSKDFSKNCNNYSFQITGKFVVVSSNHIDQFVITRAGGRFASNVLKDITLEVNENLLKKVNPQLIEMKIREVRQEAVDKIRGNTGSVKGTFVSL